MCRVPPPPSPPKAAAASATASAGRRKKRQMTVLLNTSCEPRFVSTESETLVLVWVCPEGEGQPPPEAQDRLCAYLFELGVVSQCKLPGVTEFMEAPTAGTIPTLE